MRRFRGQRDADDYYEDAVDELKGEYEPEEDEILEMLERNMFLITRKEAIEMVQDEYIPDENACWERAGDLCSSGYWDAVDRAYDEYKDER